MKFATHWPFAVVAMKNQIGKSFVKTLALVLCKKGAAQLRRLRRSERSPQC